MAAYRRVDDLRSPAGWLPVHRDQLRPQRSVSSMGSLYLFNVLLRNYSFTTVFYKCIFVTYEPSVLLHHWLDVRKSTRPVKIEWRSAGAVVCLQRVANDLHHGPADATATPSFLASLKSRMVLNTVLGFLETRPLNEYMSVCLSFVT